MSASTLPGTAVALALLACAACTSTRDAVRPPPGLVLPEAVVLKTGKQTFNSFFFYALDDDGRIWLKPIAPTKETAGFAPGWQRFGTGLPENAAKPDFAKPARIVAIHGDADEIMAVSDEHRHYSLRWLPNPVFPGEPRVWTDVHGWPVEGPLVWDERVRANRGWGIGRRNQIVRWFEDVEGKSFTGGGGLTTYYFLSPDGTEVCFSDSGLPPDFSHTMAGPRRSTFVARGFDVSASTMFVIGERGELFTRLADFDTNGSDVMFFDYTYDRRNKKKNVIAVPSEDWLEHARIPLAGKARLSSQITIALTGEHNQGRELRVGGLDPEGRTGYYRKPIFFQSEGNPTRREVRTWEFVAVPDLVLDPGRFLDGEAVPPEGPAPGVPLRDVALEGTLEVGGSRSKVALALLDWNLVASPATLRVKAGEDHVDLVFHTVEEWFHLKRFDPGRDGTPKKFLGTIEVPAAAWATANADLRAVLESAFRPFDRRDFGFWVEATNDYLVAEPRYPGLRDPKLFLSFTRAGGGFRTLGAARRQSLRRNGFTLAATSEPLKIATPLHDVVDAAALTELLERNRSVREELRASFEAPRDLDRKTPFYVTAPGIQVMRGLSFLLGGVGVWAPHVRNLMGELPALIAKNDELKEVVVLLSREDFEEALAILDTRIAAYERRLGEIAGKTPVAPWVFEETSLGWWSALAFGTREARVRSERGAPGAQAHVDDAALTFLPLEGDAPTPHGIALDVACGDGGAGGRLRFTVAPRALGKSVFERSLEGALAGAGRPLTLDVRVRLASVDDGPLARAFLATVFPRPDDLDAEESPGQLRIEAGRYALSVGALVFEWER